MGMGIIIKGFLLDFRPTSSIIDVVKGDTLLIIFPPPIVPVVKDGDFFIPPCKKLTSRNEL